MNVDILCTDPSHPVNGHLVRWCSEVSSLARVSVSRDYRELIGGDFLFLVSCHQLVQKPTRDLYRWTLVLHASDLPRGRGMSPHIWQVLEGKRTITVTLLNAEDVLDSGDIWHQTEFTLSGTELYDEINDRVFDAEVSLMTWALEHCERAVPIPQCGEPTSFRRRTPQDSRIDPAKPLLDSFDLLRVSDPDRYPAFFEYLGRRYKLRIERM